VYITGVGAKFGREDISDEEEVDVGSFELLSLRF
jgi:hypothetical protein